MKVVGSIKTIDEISDLLLTDELLMSMCGFNAHQVKRGSCDRGTKLRKTPIPEIRGSLCVDTVANHIVTITPGRIENFFNRCIQQLATQGVFPKKINAACDCCLIPDHCPAECPSGGYMSNDWCYATGSGSNCPPGYTFNPLDYVSFQKTLVVINGDDPGQVLWFSESGYSKGIKTMLLLTGGSYFDLGKKLDRPVFYANADIIRRFHLEAVPSIIHQKGRHMEVKEVAVSEKKAQ